MKTWHWIGLAGIAALAFLAYRTTRQTAGMRFTTSPPGAPDGAPPGLSPYATTGPVSATLSGKGHF